MALSDHVFYPEQLESKYPYTPDGKPQFRPEESWPDPWVAIGAMAAVTTSLRFVTNVYVLPARNPFVVAKAVGTAAVLSDDRVLLGIGAGWMREEFEQMGQAFAKRGARMEEMVEVLRTLWQGGMVEHHGESLRLRSSRRCRRRRVGPCPSTWVARPSSRCAGPLVWATAGSGMYHSVEELAEISAVHPGRSATRPVAATSRSTWSHRRR